MLSITTDYVTGTGTPSPYLRRIAEAGISHVHWCHHWRSDFLYSDAEIDQIADWLREYGLQLNDLHGSEGVEKSWVSAQEYQRLAGVELVKNRIHMTAKLGGDVVIMHIYTEPRQIEANEIYWKQLQKSLDNVEPYAKDRGVRIAAENLIVDNFDTIEKLFAKYSPDYIGLCYDSGHANLEAARINRLEPLKERLIALHLHDNDGAGDQHKLPFSGTVDWVRLTHIIAESAYTKCVSLESTIHQTGIEDEPIFLEKALEAGSRLTDMIKDYRRGNQ